MQVWQGSCHCGAVRFRIGADLADLYRCDCSLCCMKNALMASVHEDRFTFVSGEESLSEYNWNTGVARHFFCARCGIYPFHRKRSMPDHYGVNVHCLEGFLPEGRPVRQADGKTMTVKTGGARSLWTGPPAD